MKDFLYALLFTFCLLSVLVISAITHERDILAQCKEKGHSGKAIWTAKIKCEVIED